MTALEKDVPVETGRDDGAERSYDSLYQSHKSKLGDAEIIEFEGSKETIDRANKGVESC